MSKGVEALFNLAGKNRKEIRKSRKSLLAEFVPISQLINQTEHFDELITIFYQTEGVFAYKARNAFSPLHWLRTINNAMVYKKKPLMPFIKIIVWVLGIVLSAVLERYVLDFLLSFIFMGVDT